MYCQELVTGPSCVKIVPVPDSTVLIATELETSRYVKLSPVAKYKPLIGKATFHPTVGGYHRLCVFALVTR